MNSNEKIQRFFDFSATVKSSILAEKLVSFTMLVAIHLRQRVADGQAPLTEAEEVMKIGTDDLLKNTVGLDDDDIVEQTDTLMELLAGHIAAVEVLKKSNEVMEATIQDIEAKFPGVKIVII
jgi:hypothetical protein